MQRLKNLLGPSAKTEPAALQDAGASSAVSVSSELTCPTRSVAATPWYKWNNLAKEGAAAMEALTNLDAMAQLSEPIEIASDVEIADDQRDKGGD